MSYGDGEAMPTGRERPGEHWNARIIREDAEIEKIRTEAVVTRSVEIPEEVLAEAMDAYYSEGQYGREANEESMRAAIAAALPYLVPAAAERTTSPVLDREAVARVIGQNTSVNEYGEVSKVYEAAGVVMQLARSEAEVKAEALREAADAQDVDPGFRDPLRLKSAWLRERADEMEGKP